MQVQFFNSDRLPTLRGKRKLKKFLIDLFKIEKTKLISITYIFCSDDYLLKINQDFLKHDYYTDVITFDLSEKNPGVIGEVYVSIDRIKDNATNAGVTVQNELHRVIFHAALHLCGYNDKKPADVKQMKKKENLYLNRYFK